MSTGPERLSYVLPLALADTGRPGSDLERAALLLETFSRCAHPDEVAALLLITRPQDRPAIEALARRFPLVSAVLDETEVCASLRSQPPTFHEFPSGNHGWYRQQLVKLGAARLLDTPFYMTLDADVIFVRRYRVRDIVRDGRAVVNAQRASDYFTLFTDTVSVATIRVREERDARAAAVTGFARTGSWFYGETPALLSTSVVRSLLAHLDGLSAEAWDKYLVMHLPWTEYSLYMAYAEGTGQFGRVHASGHPNAILRFADSLWYPPEAYRTPRTVDTWHWQPRREADAIAVVAQSYLGYDVAAIRSRVQSLQAHAV